MASTSSDWVEDPASIAQLLHMALSTLREGGDISTISATLPVHLQIFQEAARDYVSKELAYHSTTTSSRDCYKPAWLKLLTLMFHHYFARMRRASSLSSTYFDPLLDGLLLLCDTTDLEALSHIAGFCPMQALITKCAEEGIDSSTNLSRSDVYKFLHELRKAWIFEKAVRLDMASQSLMPWSHTSRLEGSLQDPIPSSERVHIHPIFMLLAYEKSEPILSFPEMRWLGAIHDGYPRFDSLTSYVTARWSPSYTPYDNAALWQAAMTFGFLEAVTDVNIPSSLLLETKPNGRVVFSSRNIGILIYHWAFRVLHDRDPKKSRAHHSLTTVLRASRSLDQASQFKDRDILGGLWEIPRDDVDEIVCAISILLDAFYISTCFKIQGSEGLEYQNTGGGHHKLAVTTMYQRKMTAAGWCPFTFASFNYVQPLFWHYASTFKPFIRNSAGEHESCTESQCTVHNVDTSAYKTRHVEDDCACEFLRPSVDDVKTYLSSDGHFPVISYNGSGLVVHRDDTGPYIAISHVWADGLGSSTEVGLPTCQIKRIHAYVCQLIRNATPAFWIDGLCIPEDPDHRKKAIKRMHHTYSRADKVLVFDKSIQTLCSSAYPLEDNVFRIATSAWMQRVWTLQEALLANELYFEFSTGLVGAAHIRAMFDKLGTTMSGLPTVRLTLHLMPIFKLLEGARRVYDFRSVCGLLTHRMMSKPADEPLVVAGLLEVDIERIDNSPDLGSRIQSLLVELKTIPIDLIWNICPRMEGTPFFRWAPKSLTSIGPLDKCPLEEANFGEGVCTRRGLTTFREIPVFCLPTVYLVADMGEDNIFIHEPTTGVLYRLPNPSKNAEDGPRAFNAIVLPRPFLLGSRPDGTILDGLAVNVLGSGDQTCEDARDIMVHNDTKPIVCEYAFPLDLWHAPMFRDLLWLPKEYIRKFHLVEARLVMAKVTFR